MDQNVHHSALPELLKMVLKTLVLNALNNAQIVKPKMYAPNVLKNTTFWMTNVLINALKVSLLTVKTDLVQNSAHQVPMPTPH